MLTESLDKVLLVVLFLEMFCMSVFKYFYIRKEQYN